MGADVIQELKGGWHLDKRVNLSHIIATAMMVLTFAGYAIINDRRITTLEVTQRGIMEMQRQDRKMISEHLGKMASDIEYIRRRLERQSD